MDKVTSKSLELQKKIEDITFQGKKTDLDIVAARQTVANAESELREARLTAALEKSETNQQAVESARARLEQAKKELEDLEFLKEALTRKGPEVEADLSCMKRELGKLEVTKMVAMCPDLILAYNDSLRQAFDYRCRLKVIVEAVQERMGLPSLREIDENLGLWLKQW